MGLNKDERTTLERSVRAQLYASSEFLKAQKKMYEDFERTINAKFERLESKTFWGTIKRWLHV
jgi:hypothetical protein